MAFWKRVLVGGILLMAGVFAIPALALAKTPKIRLTGPPKERGQLVGQAFQIGVAATGFDTAWVEVHAPDGVVVLPMERKKTNYLTYTPQASGEHTIMAIAMVDGNARQWTSSITITVFPIDAAERAQWMVEKALSCVGSTDAAKYVEGTSLSEGDDWCAAFIGWCAKQVHIPYGAGLQAIFAGVDIYAEQEGQIACKTCRGNHLARFRAAVIPPQETPMPGDLVFFIWGSKQKAQLKAHAGYLEHWHGNASHVGIVTSVQDDNFTFVHGNIRRKGNLFGVVLNQSMDEMEGGTYADWVIAFGRPYYDYSED